MKSLKVLVLFIAMLSVVLISGCAKYNDDAPPKEAQKFEVKTVQIPQTMSESNDPNAQITVGYINMLNSLSGLTSMLTPPGECSPLNLKSGDTGTYTWDVNDNSGTYTIKLTINENNVEIAWDIHITGTMENETLDNFLFIHATQKKDESGSVFTVWDPKTGDKDMEISWQIMNDSSTQFVFEVFDETYLSVDVNSDTSGTLEMKEWSSGDYSTTYKATWEDTGHGQYWVYNNGELVDEGSW
ncbi:MAG: hypothetical protein J7L96_01785 [Bacteroidales bacterium]|nr:hypothetical protein [Bacteroidales bacterium]